jgi:hypothetical protein
VKIAWNTAQMAARLACGWGFRVGNLGLCGISISVAGYERDPEAAADKAVNDHYLYMMALRRHAVN